MLVAVRHSLDELVHEALHKKRVSAGAIENFPVILCIKYVFTLMRFGGSGVEFGPFPVLSIYRFRSVLRYSNTCTLI